MNISKMMNQVKNVMGVKLYHSIALSAVEREREGKSAVRFVLLSALVCLVALEPSIATAATDNLTTAANNILGLFTGTLGKAVATIAVVVMGLMAMFGKLEWERAFKVILGIAIVFGAAKFVTLIAGSTAINSI